MARRDLMDLARRLAERGRYTVAPNPLVGAVISRDEKVLGEGWHARAGGHHAEVAALASVDSSTRGATMHVTLEPCNHHGRTPPCTEAIIHSGISEVIVGRLDPDPRMRGQSVAVLREAGITVEVLDEPDLGPQNEQFFTAMRMGRPYVHLKLASTLDGRIAAANGDSKWITTDAARWRARMLRAEAGAVLVGARTVRNDDPLLTARDLEDPPRIVRAVLDPQLTTTPETQLARTAGESPVVIFARDKAIDKHADALEKLGVAVVSVPDVEGGLDLDFTLEELWKRDVRGVLVEGGGETAAAFMKRNLVDKLTLFYAPRLLGAEGIPMIGKLHLARMSETYGFQVSDVELLDGDLAVTLYPSRVAKEDDVYRAG
ncbi:MAG: bifunctional diaminohydroxyphosphoribosylaminopyrimidine deaminase/5-amino-6-(5-phosphoribosylamino)uracil reductase RibD [Rubrobacteraceae bacterium]